MLMNRWMLALLALLLVIGCDAKIVDTTFAGQHSDTDDDVLIASGDAGDGEDQSAGSGGTGSSGTGSSGEDGGGQDGAGSTHDEDDGELPGDFTDDPPAHPGDDRVPDPEEFDHDDDFVPEGEDDDFVDLDERSGELPGVPANLPRFEPHFNVPVNGQTDDHLEDVLIGLLERAKPGSIVRGAFYTWSRTRVARAFVDAHGRGVDVRLVVGNHSVHDDGQDWAAITVLKDGLGNRFTICSEGRTTGGCIGDGIMHNKFTIFSDLDDGSRNVVFQSSANHTGPQRVQFNNALIIRGDETLYNAYFDYWRDLRAQVRNLNYYRSTVGDYRTKAYFYPRSRGDTIVSILNNVTCDADSHIHVAMAFFSNPRVAVAEALADLKREGCKVSVITREAYVGSQVLAALNVRGLNRYVFPRGATHSVHSKYLLINAPYGANARRQKLVFTGSHNYTGPSLRNHDETLLKIENGEVYDAYLQNWQMMRARF
jgi:hypothetical protein